MVNQLKARVNILRESKCIVKITDGNQMQTVTIALKLIGMFINERREWSAGKPMLLIHHKITTM